MVSKKRKRAPEEPSKENEVDTSKPTAIFEPKEGRAHTLSIALPGSIVANAQTAELQTVLVGQVARALAVFCVDEVVVFDDGQVPRSQVGATARDSYTGHTDPNYFLVHVLAYLETPPHLRKQLFPMHPDLRLAGTLPSLDMPHHLRRADWCQFREGITIPKNLSSRPHETAVNQHDSNFSKNVTRIETGLPQAVFVSGSIPAKTRLTVKFKDTDPANIPSDVLMATAVAPSLPREEAGYYWGYSTRSASSLSTVFTECPFDGGYDLTIGTSERGSPLYELDDPKSKEQEIPEFRHMMIVFGGVAGLEVAVRADKELAQLGVQSPEALFDRWVNLLPGQGSRTIRTEEAIWLALMGMRESVLKKGR